MARPCCWRVTPCPTSSTMRCDVVRLRCVTRVDITALTNIAMTPFTSPTPGSTSSTSSTTSFGAMSSSLEAPGKLAQALRLLIFARSLGIISCLRSIIWVQLGPPGSLEVNSHLINQSLHQLQLSNKVLWTNCLTYVIKVFHSPNIFNYRMN